MASPLLKALVAGKVATTMTGIFRDLSQRQFHCLIFHDNSSCADQVKTLQIQKVSTQPLDVLCLVAITSDSSSVACLANSPRSDDLRAQACDARKREAGEGAESLWQEGRGTKLARIPIHFGVAPPALGGDCKVCILTSPLQTHT